MAAGYREINDPERTYVPEYFDLYPKRQTRKHVYLRFTVTKWTWFKSRGVINCDVMTRGDRITLKALDVLPSARLTLHSTKLWTRFKITKKIMILRLPYLWGIFKHVPKFEGHTSSGRHTNKTWNLLTKLWSFKVIWTFFGACSWLCCAPVDGLTKKVEKQLMCSP